MDATCVKRARRWVGFALFAWALGASAATDARWLRVTAPEFTVITSLGEKEAVAWSGEFSQFVAALQDFIPVDKRRLPRLTVVVFARERDYVGYRPLGADGRPQEAAGFFSRRESWAVAGLSATGLTAETRRTIFHEGTHWFLSAFEVPNPIWLEEGLAEVFSTFSVDKKGASWGRAIDQHVHVLNVVPLLPVQRLMFVSKDDLFTGGEEGSLRTGVTYAESWAFVHYLLFGQRDVPKTALVDYARLLGTATHPDERFKTAFGITYAEMDRKLESYLRGGHYFVATRPLAALPPLKAEAATNLEVEDALTRLCLGGHRKAEALAHAQKVLAAAAESSLGYELLGQVYEESGEAEKAQQAYQQAIERGSRDYRPYFTLAVARHNGAVETDGSVRNLSPADARGIANNYEKAINLNPRFRPAYQSLGGLVELLPPPNTEDERFLELGAKLYPDDGMIRLGLATLAKKAGDEAAAKKWLDEILASENQPSRVLGYARRIEAAWAQRDVFGRIDELAKDKKYPEALALIEAQIGEQRDPGIRLRLQGARQNLQGAQRVEAAREAWDNRQWVEARRLLNEIVESDAPPMVKIQMRRRLEEMDRRKLGLPKANP